MKWSSGSKIKNQSDSWLLLRVKFKQRDNITWNTIKNKYFAYPGVYDKPNTRRRHFDAVFGAMQFEKKWQVTLPMRT